MKILAEFKEFAMRGNVLDLAIGIVIGTAFGAITNSLVKDIIMPPIGALMGKMDFSNMKLAIIQATAESEAVTINYGLFIQTLINFIIVAWAMFMMIKIMNSLKKKEETTPKAPPATPPKQEILLEEIRDLLKERK
ncbi:MAG: large conductance mechanosensitive channel protein MscL [Alphaproteobacteria bacterium CG_4_9_14_3_um_filter_47_13]|nr:MAG: large conductance mechanosensitive channel protein MscL [Alphaproteobacteria bacterium CG_4_9_14_3_um_filter_47_13]